MSTRMKAKRRNDFHQLHNKDPPTSQTKYSDYCRSSKKEFKVFIAKFVLQDQHLNLFGNLFKGLAKGGRLCLTKRGNISKSLDYSKDFLCSLNMMHCCVFLCLCMNIIFSLYHKETLRTCSLGQQDFMKVSPKSQNTLCPRWIIVKEFTCIYSPFFGPGI